MDKLIDMKKGYTFDDLLIVPQHSNLESRQDANVSTVICGQDYHIPIISANMDSCTELPMAMSMQDAGGLGVLHRFISLLEQVRQVNEFYSVLGIGGNIGVSIGVNGDSVRALHTWLQTDQREYDLNDRPSIIVIDIAHGDSAQVFKMIDLYWKLVSGDSTSDRPKLMVGNVATYDAALRIMQKRVDAIKGGVDPGSMCTTRIVTGCGIPQMTAINNVVNARRTYNNKLSKVGENYWVNNISIIADGGIKNSGDIVKALAIGADAVMVGGLFAGTYETPGEIITSDDDKQYKIYRGMASKDAQLNRDGKPVDSDNIVPEGAAKLAPVKGHISDVIHQLIGGVKSGMSYCGVTTLAELRNSVEFIEMTQHGMSESIPHGIKG